MGLLSRFRRRITPDAGDIAPGPTSAVMHRALDRAVRGVGPLRGAAAVGDRALRRRSGSPHAAQDAVHAVVGRHVRLAAVLGFVTNVGGLVTLAATLPTNIAGLALLQCRMVAAVAHLDGYDLDDPRVRNAVLAALLGRDQVDRLAKSGRLPGPPKAIAAADGPGAELDRVVASQVATALVGRVAGRRVVTAVAERIPVVGGFVGAAADGFTTWRVGRYAATQFAPTTD